VKATLSRFAILLVALIVPTLASRAEEQLLAARRLFKPVVRPAGTDPGDRRPEPHVLDFGVTAAPESFDELPEPNEPASADSSRNDLDGDAGDAAVSTSDRLSADPSLESVAPDARDASIAAGCSVWFVSTRELPLDCDATSNAAAMHYETYVSGAGWTPATHEDLLASDHPHTRTTVYVHGNWATADDARYTGQKMRELLTADSCAPWRFVIFTWPADRCPTSAVKDARLKAGRAEAQAYYLAWLLDRLDPEVPVTLVGYSYGTRLIASCLHLLGGGDVHHRQLIERVHPERCGIRAILIAAAIDANCFAVDGRYSAAMSSVECVLATVNARDPYLRYYSLLYGAGGPPALGYQGVIEADKLGPAARLVSQLDVTHAVRRHHSLNEYVDAPEVLAELRHFTQAEAIAVAPPNHAENPIETIDAGIQSDSAETPRKRRLQKVGHAH
jgi:esterase/lipase superfamily enzyme